MNRRFVLCALLGLGVTLAAPPAAAQAGTRASDQARTGGRVTKDGQRGQRTIICRGGTIPPGWILVDDLRDPNSCDGSNPAALNAYNVWAIEKYSDRPVGTVIEVCASTPTPAGWTLVDIYRNRDACGHPSELFSANVKKIRRSN